MQTNLFQLLTITKISLMNQISARCKKLLARRSQISLNWYKRYNTWHKNWRPATTTYWILAQCYKLIADIEDLGQLMPGSL
jgi:hypothetical protein